jgi:hypothetical protein
LKGRRPDIIPQIVFEAEKKTGMEIKVVH